jgi:hypothetical protein
VARGGFADRDEVRVGDGVNDGVTAATLLQLGHRVADGVGALIDGDEGDEADGGLGLVGQDADEVGVGHRRKRVVLHAAFVQQGAADEQVALVDGARVGRERRACEREPAVEGGDEGVGDGSDVAPWGAVEGGAVFEEKLTRAGGLQPLQRRQGFVDCLAWRRGA